MLAHVNRTAPKPAQTAASPGSSTASAVQGPSFGALFTGAATTGAPTAAAPPQPAPNPTAESVFGPNPFLANPTGTGPNGVVYAYNPMYFATPQAAAKVAQMLGGTVVESNSFTPNGGPFAQSQPCQMVKLPDGRLINAGVIVTHYTHNYPQSYIDQLIAGEVRST